MFLQRLLLGLALLTTCACASTADAPPERPAASANAPTFFHGCVQLKDVPLGVVCDGRVVFVMCSHEGLCDVQTESASFLVAAQTDPSAVRNTLVKAGERKVGESVVVTSELVRRDGQKVVVVERVRGAEGEVFRNAVCARPALDRFAARCARLIEAVVSQEVSLKAFQDVEAEIPVERIPLSIAERSFETPAGCPKIEVERGERTMGIEAPIKGARLACESATLSWTTTSTLKQALGMLLTQPPGGPLSSARVPCTIEGVQTNCARWMGPDGTRLIEGFVRVRDHVLFSRCEWNTQDDPTEIPAPCDQVFDAAALSMAKTSATP